MNIVVCVNHTPDTETKVKIGPDGRTIDPTGVNYILNPYDEFAVEAALKLKEQHGGQTIAMTLGGDAHRDVRLLYLGRLAACQEHNEGKQKGGLREEFSGHACLLV